MKRNNMIKHEFGIMQTPPVKGQRYDEYEPEKYDCISIPDDEILLLQKSLSEISFFWHTIDKQEKGLAYYGVTLISPSSIEKMIPITEKISAITPLTALLKQAMYENKYVIHFGI